MGRDHSAEAAATTSGDSVRQAADSSHRSNRLSQIPVWATDFRLDSVRPLLCPGNTGRLLDAVMRTRAEGRFGGDLSGIRIHDDAPARRALDALGARAATHDHDIFWSSEAPAPTTPRGRALLWHELAHVAQQRDRDATAHSPLVSSPSDHDERQATAPGSGPLPSTAESPLIHCDRHAKSSSDIQEIHDAMDANPDTGPLAALELLREYPLEEAVVILVDLDRDQRLEKVAGAIVVGDNSPLAAAIMAVLYLSPNKRPTPAWGIVAATILAGLPEAQRTLLLEQVLTESGRGAEIQQLREGTAALAESETARANTPVREVDSPAAAAAAPMLGGVTPGPWNPGGQPIPFYLGNAAHVSIAAFYAAAHVGDEAFYNFVSVGAIVKAAERLGLSLGTKAATPDQLALQPDIANLSKLHLFEIKPSTLQGLGRTEAALYVAAFAAAGLAIGLGPTSEPGTAGIIPAPGGWYEFRSPEPGVITYNYRQPPRVRVRVPEGEPEPTRVDNRSLREKIAAITGLTGTALTIYLIISEGSRLFPPRNLVPVP